MPDNETQERYISQTATIGPDAVLGRFVVIEDEVVIGAGCSIGHNVVIHAGTVIGDNVRIDANTVVGKQPMRSKRSIFKDEKTLSSAEIGDGCLIGAQVVVYAGCKIAGNVLIGAKM